MYISISYTRLVLLPCLISYLIEGFAVNGETTAAPWLDATHGMCTWVPLTRFTLSHLSQVISFIAWDLNIHHNKYQIKLFMLATNRHDLFSTHVQVYTFMLALSNNRTPLWMYNFNIIMFDDFPWNKPHCVWCLNMLLINTANNRELYATPGSNFYVEHIVQVSYMFKLLLRCNPMNT
jgi:hypothetical protein